uniref:Ig-like domain-containing protein n=1 Tax=Astyanax mexicanus TaxID=7994 RepID=A0A3B1IFQ4_ASTMX
MASHSLLFLAVVFSFICSGALEEKLIRVECQPAVGVVGQTMKIHCSFISSFKEINIDLVYIFKSGPENPVFSLKNIIKTGDLRFNLPSENNPSLELASAAVADEGNYRYMIVTNRGVIEDGSFRIGVTSKYHEPTTISWPEKIEEGGSVDLYCNASGGYPAGSIQWFDNTNTDWTKSATLKTTEGEDKLVQLSSKLTFKKIDLNWVPFRCVVLNSKFVKERESTFHLKFTGVDTGSSVTVSVVLMVTGIIVVAVLMGLLFRRRRIQQGRRPSAQPILRASAVRTTLNTDEEDDENEDGNEAKAEGQIGECFRKATTEQDT